ncbi:SGNH/GDSL hydrolase family protein [Cytobacillus sp. Hz8]|uniref:SGNH/GDSL hydrolase family protein n=1 Tax=Cytobacillus sp. Hz8 TaxID=3347168 RepID=UPI0035D7041B
MNKENLIKYKESGLSTKASVPNDFVPIQLKVVSIGDSLTEGIGDSTKRGGYLPYLKKHLEKEKGIKEVEFSNFGVKGNRSSQILERLHQPEVGEALRESDMVIMTMGGNDLMKVVKENFLHLQVQDFDKEKQNYKNNLQEMLKLIRKENPVVTIVLIGLYNPFSHWFSNVKEMDHILNDWNNTSKSVLSEYDQTFFVEIADIFKKNEEELLYTDYFHPNDKGYKLIANRVYERLDEQALAVIENKKFTSRKEAY